MKFRPGSGLIPAFDFVTEVTHENYHQLATRTERVPTGDTTIDPRLIMPLIGAIKGTVNIGGAIDDLKRAIYYGQSKDPVAIMQKIGDVGFEANNQNLVLTPEQYRMLHASFGLVTEAIEFLESVSSSIFNGKPIDVVHVFEELGDMSWYGAIPSNLYAVPMLQWLSANIAKLRSRYPDKFTEEKALNRDLETERKVLEQTTQASANPPPPAL